MMLIMCKANLQALLEDFGGFTVRILHGKLLTRKRSFHFNIDIVRLLPCLKHSAVSS